MNRRIFSRPPERMDSASFGSFNTDSIKPRSSCSFLGSVYKADGPPASSRQEPVAAITGIPASWASKIGIPNPSKNEG